MANSSVAFVGRVLFAILFIGAGISKLTEWDAKTGGPISHVMNPKIDALIARYQLAAHLPKDYASHYPYLILATGVVEVLGALLLIVNVPVGACLLLSFLLIASFVIHDFWNLPSGATQQQEMIQFLKNLSLIGGCLIYLGGLRKSSSSKKKLD